MHEDESLKTLKVQTMFKNKVSHLEALGTPSRSYSWKSSRSLSHKVVKYVCGPPIDMCIMHRDLLAIHHQPPTLPQKYSNG